MRINRWICVKSLRLIGLRLLSAPFNLYVRVGITRLLSQDKISNQERSLGCLELVRSSALVISSVYPVGGSGFLHLAPNADPARFSMCRGWSEEMEGTVFTPSLEGMNHVKSPEGEMLTKQFLDVCKLILPVIDKFGAAMALVKSDIGGNITRLESKYSSDPSKFEYLYNMVRVEVETKTAKSSSSCTNGLLWLTRAMDFLVELFRNLLEHPDWTMPQACTDSYSKTLKKWHGWLASASFTVAMKLAPDRKKFMDVIGGSGDINADMEKFCTTFSPLLQENHKFLASVGLDDLKAS